MSPMRAPLAWNGRRVLVTGGDGFIGSRLACRLVEYGAVVTALVKRPPPESGSGLGAWRLLGAVTVRIGDVGNPNVVATIVEEARPDVVFHLAAQSLVAQAQKNAWETIDTNVRGTQNVLESSCRAGARAVVVASSDKAYGSGARLPYTEDTPLRGTNVYEASKVAAEAIVRAVACASRLPVAITRCANVFGPADHHASRIVPDVSWSLAANRAPVIRGSGEHRRDLLFLDDAVDGYLALAEAVAAGLVEPGEAFNFGSGVAVRIRDLVDRLVAVSGRPQLRPAVMALATPFEIAAQCVDATKARERLGWRPQVTLDDGLQRTFRWYAEHPR